MDDTMKRCAITFMPYDRPWNNVELIKDCGLIPYLFAKEFAFTVYMIGKAPEGAVPGLYTKENEDQILSIYPYYQYVDDINLLLTKEYTPEIRMGLLEQFAEKTDCLILRGCYQTNIPLAFFYKKLNPKGKVYCGLDANSTWMDSILWDDPVFLQFLCDTDVMATSCRAMADLLSEKWPKKVYTITNGTYDFLSEFSTFVPYSQRENMILTVGRLGTYQKATELLVKAFLLIEAEVPDWKLVLIGNETEDFKTYMQGIFDVRPDLRKRVLEKGEISDRHQLYTEYKRAKIFALTSRLEGGTPNAAADALSSGLVMAVTKVDAWQDMIADGRCGMVSPIDDINQLASNLLTLCKSDALESMGRSAFVQAGTLYSMEKNVHKLYKLLFDATIPSEQAIRELHDRAYWERIVPDFNQPIYNKSRIPFHSQDATSISAEGIISKIKQLDAQIFKEDCQILPSIRGNLLYLMIGMMSHFSGVKPVHVAEIGCADGRLSAIISEIVHYYQAENFYTAITNLLGDGSQDIWVSHVSKAEIPNNISYLACDFQDTNLRNESFELTIIQGTTQFDNVTAVYQEAVRITKSPGYLVYIPSSENTAQNEAFEERIIRDHGKAFQTKDGQGITILIR